MHTWVLDKKLIVYPKAQRYNFFVNKINQTLFKYATFILNQQGRYKAKIFLLSIHCEI